MGAVASTQREVPGGVVCMGHVCAGRGAEQGVCLLQITALAAQWLLTEGERAAGSHLYSWSWVETQKKATEGWI